MVVPMEGELWKFFARNTRSSWCMDSSPAILSKDSSFRPRIDSSARSLTFESPSMNNLERTLGGVGLPSGVVPMARFRRSSLVSPPRESKSRYFFPISDGAIILLSDVVPD